jgi:ankyrin repeat protein
LSACTQVIDFLEQAEKVEASSQALLTKKWGGWDSSYSKRFPSQMTGLHLVAYFGVTKAATASLQRIIDVNVKDTCVRTPLLYAAEKGNEAVVKLLLGNGAAADSQDENSRTPLMYAAKNGNEAVIQLLLDDGAAADSQDKDGWTSLMYAAKEGE